MPVRTACVCVRVCVVLVVLIIYATAMPVSITFLVEIGKDSGGINKTNHQIAG